MNQKDYWERRRLERRRSPEHPVIAAYVLPKVNVVRGCVRLTKQTRLLDVGCGNGFFTFYFDRICDAYGVDFSMKMLKMNPLKKTFLMDAADLKFEENSFDVVFCHSLLHHVERIDRVVREMRRVSRKQVVILEPNRDNPFMFLFSLAVREERRGLRFSLSYVRDIVSRSGLRIVRSFSYGMVVPMGTPTFLLPLAKRVAGLFNFNHPLGITNFIIAEKGA